MHNTVLGFAVFFIVIFPTLAESFTVSGTYNTTEGKMTLRQQDDQVTGYYGNDNGELNGTLHNRTMEGVWIEDQSARRCSTSQNGRYYWGKISIKFTNEGFSGKWGYCNDPLTSSWSGTRTSPPSQKQSTQSQPDKHPHDELNIEGVWRSSEGDIRFRQQNNRVSGRYATDNGEITGSLDNATLRGYWIEDHSSHRCNTSKNGRYHWGSIELKFDGNRFTGRWGYCNEAPTQTWSGQRK